MTHRNICTWSLRIIASVILLQTLFFKFTASDESVYIFETLGLEPIGRIGSGIAELFAAILILIPKTTVYGAFLGAGIMLGAVFSHIFVLGIEVKNDSGLLFVLALVTVSCCLILIWQERSALKSLL